MPADPRQARNEPADRLKLEQYRPELHRYLLRCMKRRQDVEDLLQEVYLRFLRSPHPELVRQPRPYLYRIATNVVMEFNLHQKRRPLDYDSQATLERLEQDAAADAWHDSIGDELSDRQALKKMLAPLAKIQRAVLLLRIEEGLSHEEIATRLNISEPTARAYLSRALAQCKAAAQSEGL